MRSATFRNAGFTLALGAILMLSGCSSTPVKQAQWSAPELGAQSRLLQSGPVLVACDFYDAAVRQICLDEMVRAVRAKGGTPVMAPVGTSLMGDREPDAQLVAPAMAVGARTVLVLALTPTASESGSGLSVGLGGFSFGRGSGVGLGFSAPIGGERTGNGWAANARVTDAQSGKLVWTTSLATSSASNDLRAQVQALAAAVADAAQVAGLF